MPPMVAPTNNQPATTDINAAYGSLGSVYDPKIAQVQAQQAQALTTKNTALSQLAQDHTTNLSSLDQAKANAFKSYGATAAARGMTFSGYTPEMSDQYTANVYNPNVDKTNTTYGRNVDSTNNTYTTNNQTLQDKITELNQSRSNDANSIVQNTIQANQAAAKSAASAARASAKASQPTTNDIANAIRSNLSKVTGKDGYVSPEDYAQAYTDWINNGQSASTFNNQFGSLKNKSNGYYDYAITQAIKRGS